MFKISQDDRSKILKYLSTRPYAEVFQLVAMLVGLKTAEEDKKENDKKERVVM